MQALIAGVLASLAAFFTIFLLREQILLLQREIKQNEEINRENIVRDLKRLKARNLFSAIQLSDYLATNWQIIINYRNNFFEASTGDKLNKSSEERSGDSIAEFPEPKFIGVEVVNNISELAKYSSPNDAEKISDLLARWQIHTSRMKSFQSYLSVSENPDFTWNLRADDFNSLLFDCIVLHDLQVRLLKYCRKAQSPQEDHFETWSEHAPTAYFLFDKPDLLFNDSYFEYCKNREWPPASIEELQDAIQR